MPEKVGLAPTLVPNVSTRMGHPLTFAESSLTVHTADTEHFYLCPPFLFYLLLFASVCALPCCHSKCRFTAFTFFEFEITVDNNCPSYKDLLQLRFRWRCWRLFRKSLIAVIHAW